MKEIRVSCGVMAKYICDMMASSFQMLLQDGVPVHRLHSACGLNGALCASSFPLPFLCCNNLWYFTSSSKNQELSALFLVGMASKILQGLCRSTDITSHCCHLALRGECCARKRNGEADLRSSC